MKEANPLSSGAAVTPDVQDFRAILLNDYRLACISREASLLGRKEVLGGKAKFGIFGDGKELAQIALAKVLKNGDWRSGYYRDQTLMMAKDLLSVREYFAALYADTDLEREPSSAGRQMGGHFATRFLDDEGGWQDHMTQFNSSADISPTGGQMPRLLGLAQASKLYRLLPDVASKKTGFTSDGGEIAIGTIGDASTSEGLFWETMNAAGVLQVPMLMNVWDDGYGISVPKEFQTTKGSISEALSGMQKREDSNGIVIFRVKGWDFPQLIATYEQAVNRCRTDQVPVLVHVEEVTQPQGHSTSGSHERYKSAERMAWAAEYDCIEQFGKFLMLEGAATEDELNEIRKESKVFVRSEQKAAWAAFRQPIDDELKRATQAISRVEEYAPEIKALNEGLFPGRAEIHGAIRQVIQRNNGKDAPAIQELKSINGEMLEANRHRYSHSLYSEGKDSAMKVVPVAVRYDEDEWVDGRQILQKNFEVLFEKFPELLTFGEDTGKIGGVNQVMEGMQKKFGELRVSDTGIRECTIAGQGIGLAMRGWRPIAEIQYLDYLFYALQILRDDAATVRYRSAGGQKAPVIIRTRGHRLEGIWHSGSPMGTIVNALRGMYVCVPRNMTQAAGMYNTLLQAEEPALVIECLNGYRIKEKLPSNLGEYSVPLGKAEVVRSGSDLTLVSYGSTFNLAANAAERLESLGIDIELVDLQTLLPLDLDAACATSLAKTNRLLVVDEDVPGGASAYILEDILNRQGGWRHLDSPPKTLTAKPHLPPYGSDGDYYSKPSIDDICEAVIELIKESEPNRFQG
ncbi:MAG: thiamine pyrophosphate-dependent enzyme [Bacteroidetes bacterium]|nr:thiamine pyrophosphate-dependent enzyme [Bacteroidota bacterium]MDA1335753.1 thiamine pyrophosphate-dependent enzyme [Bacteroidota bacterium]